MCSIVGCPQCHVRWELRLALEILFGDFSGTPSLFYRRSYILESKADQTNRPPHLNVPHTWDEVAPTYELHNSKVRGAPNNTTITTILYLRPLTSFYVNLRAATGFPGLNVGQVTTPRARLHPKGLPMRWKTYATLGWPQELPILRPHIPK